jgi:D-lactate dehydrogenase (cytochrome)
MIYTLTLTHTEIWKIRKECLWSVMSQNPDKEPMITDVCVPLSELPKLIAASRKLTDASFLHAPMIAHAGESLLYGYNGHFLAIIILD